MGRYSKVHSNYVLSKTHQVTNKGRILVRDWVTTGGQHQIEKGKKPYYSDTNFLFTDNSYPSYKKKHNYGKWVAHWDYDDVKTASDDVNNVKVNTSSNDIRDFAYYGSAVELVRSSVTNIINWFPARVTLLPDNIYVPNVTGGYDTLVGYYQLNNPFEVDFIHTLSKEEKERYNINRFLMESYSNYTLNGQNIKKYDFVNRKFITKTETKKRTVKHKVTDFSFESTETINRVIKPFNLLKNNIELVSSNKLQISDFNYNQEISNNTTIETFDKNNGSIYVDSTEYTANPSASFLKDSTHESNAKLTVSGYGFDNEIKYNGIDVDVTVNNGNQTLSRVTFQPGYTYKIGENEFTVENRQTVIPVYSSNNGERKIIFTIDGVVSEFDVSDYLSEYNDNEIIITNIEINGINDTEETITVTFKEINVNNSNTIGTFNFNGIYNFIIANSDDYEYIDAENTLSFSSKELFFNQYSKKIVCNEGTVIDLSSYDISDDNFTLSFLKKSESVIISSFYIHPCLDLSLQNGGYFVEIDGNRSNFNWEVTCYKETDESNRHVLSNIRRIRLHQDKLQLIKTNGSIDSWEIPVSGFSLNNICFYIEENTYPSYTFIQCVTDEQIDDFINNKGWSLMTCFPSVWLPTLDMRNGWNEYVKECTECVDGSCYVSVLISRLSEIMEDGDYKNMPLYTLYITTEDGTEHKLEAYILNGKIILITTSNQFDLKCKKNIFDKYFESLEGFEKQLLTLDSHPLYKNSFLTPIEGELVYKYVYRDYTWPSTFDSELGYGHIDIVSDTYIGYLSKLIDMATVFDELWTDNIYRNMTHESIKNFDWTYTREYNEGEEQDNIDGGNQIMKLLRIYGRAFDDIKKLSDGIGYVTKNTYDGYGNQPDAEISDRLEMMGWDITSTIPNFQDTEQGYIGKDTGYVINKATFDNLTSSEQTSYEKAYINYDTAQIIGENAYNGLEDVVKKRFSKYFPVMDLSDVKIDETFTESFGKKNGSSHAKWFNSTNSDNIDTSKSDIDFMKKLLLSSNRIFNTKGTKQSIDMVMGMFGFGEDDYELIESYYTTTPKEFTDELYEEIENINYYKDYPKNYDDIYSGVPLKDIFIGNKHLIVPFYSQKRTYDGDFMFESRGGWANKDNGYYTETLSYLHVVGDFSSLLDINPNSLNDGDIYYVVSLANYTDYVNTLPDDLSHFFYLKDNGKYNPQLPESWENVNMEAFDDEHTKKAKYLNSIISSNIGNNPHVGYGTYDGGAEFKEYMEKPFKFSIDEYLLDEEWKTKAENINYTLSDGEDSDKVKVLIEDDASKYYINRKLFIMKNKLGGDLFKKYFTDVIAKYVMQVIPSTVILVLENFDSSSADSEIESYGDLTVSLEYPDIINYEGTNTSSPRLTYRQKVYMKDGSEGEITSGATVSYRGANGYVNLSNGIVSGVGANPTSNQRPVEISTVTVTLNGITKTASATIYQQAGIDYGDITVTLEYRTKILADGSNYSEPTLSYKQIVTNPDGTTTEITTGGRTTYTGAYGYVNENSGIVSGVGPNSLETEKIAEIVTVTVELNGKTGSATANVYQLAKTITGYGDVSVTLSYPTTIPANGIGSSSPVLSYSQTVSYSDGTTSVITSGGTPRYSSTNGYVNTNSGVVSGVGINQSESTIVADVVTVNVTMNGKTGTATSNVYQDAKAISSYGDITVTLSYPNRISADGSGQSSPLLSYSQIVNYSDGSTETIYNDPSASISYIGIHVESPSTGIVSGVGPNSSDEDKVVSTVTVTVSANGKTGTATADVWQSAKTITGYSEITVSLSYPDIIPADGTGVSHPTLSYSQMVYYSDGNSDIITSGAESISYSSEHNYVDTSNGNVSGVGSNPYTTERIVDTVTVTIVMNGKTGTDTADVKQAARSAYQVRWIDEN